MKREKLLLTFPSWSVFVETDFEILSTRYEVEKYHFRPVKGAFAVFWEIIRQFIFLIFNIWRFDIVFIWFADQHSFLPILFSKITGKKSYLVIGGYDVCRIKHLNYGVFCSKIRGYAASWSMKNSTLNLPVSKNVARKVKAISHKTNYNVVYNCVKLRSSEPEELQVRDNILTVAIVDSERTYYIKGIDLFVDTARLLPQFQFIIVGFKRNCLKNLQKNFPSNVKLVEETLHKDLPQFYKRAKVYCQLSRSESFGIALAESILYGCIPIVTNEGGMPEVVGDRNYITGSNPEEIATKIVNIFSEKNKTDSFAARRIKEIFGVENRRSALINLLSGNSSNGNNLKNLH